MQKPTLARPHQLQLESGFKEEVKKLTWSSFFCHSISHSLPAASMHPSTAAPNSPRIDRMNSSAFGERCEKSWEASNKMAEGDVEPGKKID